ncbi:MAG: histidine phosphatase family protein [Cyclobacteriaceae bacterium]|jgi:broad specificity phosphatase PhoE|nr:histidine phosphatase family protein [Cyclobacteriaceae bacterium]
MKTRLLFVWLLAVGLPAPAQSPSLTTFILVRHAEKATNHPTDPDLSEKGRERAQRLAELLTSTSLDAVYSTRFMRTWQTAEPVAQVKNLPVVPYEPFKDEVIQAMLTTHAGKTILLVGHSNTTPWMANALLGRPERADFSESEYGTVLIVTVSEKGKVASLVALQY